MWNGYLIFSIDKKFADYIESKTEWFYFKSKRFQEKYVCMQEKYI